MRTDADLTADRDAFEWNTRGARHLAMALALVGARIAREAAPRVAPAPYVSTQYPPCCAKATRINGCFCIVGYACTVHGEKHYGSHD